MSQMTLSSDRVHVGVTALGGQLDDIRFLTAAGTFAPMHTAPWINEDLPDDIPPMLKQLRGDFFCAPFGDSDVLDDEQRPHGSTANDTWELVDQSDTRVVLELTRPVMGATVRKTIRVRRGHAAVYQEHTFTGGSGRLPIGHHAMLRLPDAAHLSFSPWVLGTTPPETFEGDPTRGRSLLTYPQKFDDLAHVQLADGTHADLTRYPQFREHEDLLMLVADPNQPLAWSAVTAPEAGWVWFALKSPRSLPSTILWMSNGGRYYPPFSSRHTGVLGIEEVASYFHLGHRASIEPNDVAAAGHPTAVELHAGTPLVVRYVFGLASVPPEFRAAESLKPVEGGIEIMDAHGCEVFAPLDWRFVQVAG